MTILDLTSTVHNCSVGRKGYAIIGIVDHVMDGTLVGTDAWFANAASQVSAHYGIGKNGAIHQYVRDEDEAWHAGVVDRPTSKMVLDRPGLNPNLYTIGIEHEGRSGDVFTTEQHDSTLWLHQFLIEKHSLIIDPYYIQPHSAINAGHGGCPGPGFPWAQLFAELGVFVGDDFGS